MLIKEKQQQIESLLHNFSTEELIWVNGYLHGLIYSKTNANKPSGLSTNKVIAKKITIAYATETGNAKKISTTLATIAKQQGCQIKLVAIDQYDVKNLAKEKYFIIAISTQGEGEPPATAQSFFSYIHEQKIDLGQMNFAVLGLGDTAYPLFCKAAEDVDAQLKVLGAKPILPLQKCEVDYEADAKNWFNNLLNNLQNEPAETVVNTDFSTANTNTKKEYVGEIVSHINLNDKASDKKTFHVEIKTNEPVQYACGDSLSVYPQNDVQLVNEILFFTKTNANEKIEVKNETNTVQYFLQHKFNITQLGKNFIEKYAQYTKYSIDSSFRFTLLDILQKYPLQNNQSLLDVVPFLVPLAPRLYSISSSPLAHENEVHITVALNQFTYQQQQQLGVCSNYISNWLVGNAVQFTIQPNKHFKLPSSDKNIIMIGPGTGVAPFRAFVAERDAAGAAGKNWLFFGDRSFTNDFLYQTEWQQYIETGSLHKINLAWSRDAKQKHYVQHEVIKEGKLLVEWLNKGAYLYICGDKKNMCTDVENALLQALSQHKHITIDDAKQWLEQLENEGRYQKDVY